ncbi:beta-1,3-N-acetylglucosaminyltransferase radical fringe-like isoform X2 [Dysidea avara]
MAEVLKEAGLNLVLPDCDDSHGKKALCCKSGTEFAAYYESLEKYKEMKSFQWYCHFDDDMYVNVPQLSNVLRQYDPEKPWYISSKTRNVDPIKVLNIERLEKANITLKHKTYRMAPGAAYCISHTLMMELKHFLNGAEAFTRMCVMTGKVDDFTVGLSIGSILGHYRNVSTSFKTQFSTQLKNRSAQEIAKYVCVAPNGTIQPLESYAKSINMSLSEDPTRFLTYHCLLYPTVSWCHK